MSRTAPNLVTVYDLGSWEPRRVAEFRLTAQGSIELTVLGSAGCPIAEQWYRRGVEVLGEARFVTVNDAAEFMRALLQPFRLSYYELVDESDRVAGEYDRHHSSPG
ncbi:hypothetical protein [Nocardia thraciensis]